MRYYILLATVTISLLSSCVSNFNRELKKEKYEDKTLLYKQKIKGHRHFSIYTLEEYVKQQPNRKFIFGWSMPYWRAYIKGEQQFNQDKAIAKLEKIEKRFQSKLEKPPKDSTRVLRKQRKAIAKQREVIKEGNWLMRTVGEKPSLLDSSSIEKTKEQLALFYQSKGYFNSSVSVDYKKIGYKKTKVQFNIIEGEPHKFDKIYYEIEDPVLSKIVNSTIQNAQFKTGDNYDVGKLSAERERINTLLRDHGYFEFHRNYIFYEIDTTRSAMKADITIVIENPTEGRHEKFIVRDVQFSIDALKHPQLDTITEKGITYIHGPGKFSKRVLNDQIKIRPNSPYSYSASQKTQRLLGNFDIFKFVNINYQKVHPDSTDLIAYINTNTLKRQQITTEAGVVLNVSQNQSIPGPVTNFAYRSRKVFKGFEIFEVSARYSLQGQVSFIEAGVIGPSREIGGSMALIFPRALFQNAIVPRKWRPSLQNITPKTRFSIGISDVKRIEYTRRNINFTHAYSGQKANNSYYFAPFDLNVVNTPEQDSLFTNYLKTLLAKGINLEQSFKPSIVSGTNFKYIFSNNDLTSNKKAVFFKADLEVGGAYVSLRNSLSGTEEIVTLFNLPYYQFMRVGTDLRLYRPISENATVAFRINAGIAKPQGDWETLPYEKYYFAGGLSSVRAWNPRRLGPGSYLDSLNGLPAYTFEQPGEILLESSLELRSQIVGFLHGAVFLDAGNVWTIGYDDARQGSQWKASSFLGEIAVGTGAGLRFDFSFLIFRFDVGVKVWDPGRQIIVPLNDINSRTYNIGIGYPF